MIEPYGKSPAFTVHQSEPFNGGVPAALLRESWITPYPAFYVRSHAPEIPDIDAESYRLAVVGQVMRPLSLSLEALMHDFAPVTVTATLQCAGNRRSELNAVAPMPGESVMWRDEAISTARWTGVRLADVLAAASADGLHVAFTSFDACEKDGRTFGYGGSIPLDKAMCPEVLLAYAMNDEPLPAVHGYPLRVIVPGYIAARSVKWLRTIHVQDAPSDNHFQSHDYKLFPAHISGQQAVDWSQGEMLGGLRTDALITEPADGAVLNAGTVAVRGYAMPGEGALITGVDLSTDGGATWTAAALVSEPAAHVWCFWEEALVLPSGEHTLIVRAHDSLGSVQPETPADAWNFRGYMNNARHRVQVTAR
jgi:sulfite oxidase